MIAMTRHVISLMGNGNYIQITTKMSTNENHYNMQDVMNLNL